jgi:hypothetical protein
VKCIAVVWPDSILSIPLTDEDQRIMSRAVLEARMEYMVGDQRDADRMLEFERARDRRASIDRRQK